MFILFACCFVCKSPCSDALCRVWVAVCRRRVTDQTWHCVARQGQRGMAGQAESAPAAGLPVSCSNVAADAGFTSIICSMCLSGLQVLQLPAACGPVQIRRVRRGLPPAAQVHTSFIQVYLCSFLLKTVIQMLYWVAEGQTPDLNAQNSSKYVR